VNPVRVALFGAGGFGRERIRAASKLQSLVISAVYPAFDAPPGDYVRYEDLAGALSHPGLDAVILSVPNPHHVDLGVAALRAGKHLFVEKPLANTVAEAAVLVREASTRGLVLAVGHNSRRDAHVREMRRLLDQGILGHVVMAEGHFSRDAGLRLRPGEWRWHDTTCPGGPLTLLAIHEIDTLQYLLGRVRRVFGWQRRFAASAEIPDTTVTVLEFEAGALATVGSDYVSPHARALRLFGTGGNARWDDPGGLVVDQPDRPPRAIRLSPVDSLREELDDFATSIRDGRSPEVDGVTGLINVAVVEAAMEANRHGAAVEVREVLERAGAGALADGR